MGDYADTITWLYGLQFFGMKLGLDTTRALCRYFGNPERRYPIIHVAGTNGKGSTAAVVASVLQEAGLRVGLYTSPHLVRFTERVRVSGEEIDEAAIVQYAAALRPRVDGLLATFFETTTAIALRDFADRGADVVVLETGLGGRLDATNVVDPALTVITSIGFDHMEHLGDTLASIAREKAGIIKPDVPLVSGVRNAEARAVIEATAREQRAPVIPSHERIQAAVRRLDLDGMDVDLAGERHALERVPAPFVGLHQVDNLATALATLECAEERLHLPLAPGMLTAGIEKARANTGLRCRLETIGRSPRLLCDVAHNPAAFERLGATLAAIGGGPHTWVVGIMKDKDYTGVVRAVAPHCRRMFCVTPRIGRALADAHLAATARTAGIDAVDAGAVAHGLRAAQHEAGPDGTVIVAGSHYVAGEVLETLGTS